MGEYLVFPGSGHLCTQPFSIAGRPAHPLTQKSAPSPGEVLQISMRDRFLKEKTKEQHERQTDEIGQISPEHLPCKCEALSWVPSTAQKSPKHICTLNEGRNQKPSRSHRAGEHSGIMTQNKICIRYSCPEKGLYPECLGHLAK